jgi:hypothetical protein
MATTYKILGQITGSASTSSLYTVPAATQAVVSSIVIANRSATSAAYYIGVLPSGSTIEDKNWIAYAVPVSGSDSTALTLGVTLNSFDSIQVSGNLTGSFSLFGSEIA